MTRPWELSLEDERFTLDVDGRRRWGSVLLLEKLGLESGAFWAAAGLEGANGQVLRLDGIPNSHASQLKDGVDAAVGQSTRGRPTRRTGSKLKTCSRADRTQRPTRRSGKAVLPEWIRTDPPHRGQVEV